MTNGIGSTEQIRARTKMKIKREDAEEAFRLCMEARESDIVEYTPFLNKCRQIGKSIMRDRLEYSMPQLIFALAWEKKGVDVLIKLLEALGYEVE